MYQEYDRDRGWSRFDEDEGRRGRGWERGGPGRWREREDYESGRGGGAFGEGWRAERGYGGGRGSLGEPWRGEPWRGGRSDWGGRSEWGGRPEGWSGWREGRGDWAGWQGGPDWEAESRGRTGSYGQGARFNPPHWAEEREPELGRGGSFGRRWDREGYSGGPGAHESTWTGERGGWGGGADWGGGSAGGGVWSGREWPGPGSQGGWTGWPVGAHAGRGPKGYQRSDDRIREDACEMLTRHPAIDASEIEIEVRGGEVTLKGTVDSRQAKRWAEEAIEDISGVKDVHNQLRAGLDVADRGGTMTGGTTAGATPNRAGRATMPH